MSFHSQSGVGPSAASSSSTPNNGTTINNDDGPTTNGYAAPPGVTSSLVPDGKLVDFDTAQVTALPDSLHPYNNKDPRRNGSLSSPSSSFDDDKTPTRPVTPSNNIQVKVDRPSYDTLAGRSLYSHPPLDDDDDEQGDLLNHQRIFAHRGGAPPYGNFNLYRRFRFAITQLIANTLSSTFLIFVVIWALSVRLLAQVPKLLAFSFSSAARKDWDDPDRWSSEKLVKDVRYYAETCGYQIHNETVETKDGYFLRMHRVICPETERNTAHNGKGEYRLRALANFSVTLHL